MDRSSNDIKILVVDDEIILQRQTASILESFGYSVICAQDRSDCLSAIAEHRPDMVLLDINLGKTSGFSLCTEIRNRYAEINPMIIMYSGIHFSSEDRRRGLAAGAEGYLPRGLPKDEFLEWIRTYERLKSTEKQLIRKESELRETLLRERAAVNSTNIGLWEWKPETDEMIFSPEMKAQWGYRDNEVTNRFDELQERLHPDDRDRIKPELYRIVSEKGKQCSIDLRFRYRNGTYRWALLQGTAIPGTDRQPGRVVGSQIDITYRKESELSLRNTVEKLEETREMLDRKGRWLNALNSIATQIARMNDFDNIIDTVMNCLASNLEYKIAAILLFDTDKKSVQMRSMKTSSVKLNQRYNSGTHNDFPVSSGDTQFLFQKTSQVFLFNLREMVLKDTNSAFLELIYHMKEERINGLMVLPLFSELNQFGILLIGNTDLEEFDDNVENFMKGLAENLAISYQNHTLNKNLEASYYQLKEAREIMTHQERFNAMRQIASGISHDINNTLVPISLYTETLMSSESELSDRSRKYLHTIQSAVADIERIAEKLRAFYKQEELGDVNVILVREIFEEVKELTSPRWEAVPNRSGNSIEFEISISDPLLVVTAVRSELRDSLINLVFNSADAINESGRITLRAEIEEAYIELLVEDNGTGMDSETRKHCLEPFFSTKPEKGSGLGLSTVYGMLKRAGGSIVIDSTPQTGTKVGLRFPKTVKKERTRQAVNTEIEVSPLNILCVDNDPKIRIVLDEMLSLEGHQVTGCATAGEALRLITDGHSQEKQFDLVITDLGLSDLGGMMLAEKINNIDDHISIIMLTGWGNASESPLPVTPDIDAILNKPPTAGEMRESIRSIFQNKKREIKDA